MSAEVVSGMKMVEEPGHGMRYSESSKDELFEKNGRYSCPRQLFKLTLNAGRPAQTP